MHRSGHLHVLHFVAATVAATVATASPVVQTQPSSSLKVIALISGGKDSLFSILHCLANGHQVVALANLHPPLPPGKHDALEEEGEDLNSFMYQTVGHSIIPLYAEALGLPLYRQEIGGGALNTSREYKPPSSSPVGTNEGEGVVSNAALGQQQPEQREHHGEDETESLVPLLEKVISNHPEANAVSTGAILSTYQRTRVESVALRLGLVPLSYLWQYPYVRQPYVQSSLLQDMACVGQEARIIKVASGGLDDGFLWANVADTKTLVRLRKAMSRFGPPGEGAVLGEGGEFETLALDGPQVLWKRRIGVDMVGTTTGEGGNAVVKFSRASVVERELDDAKKAGLSALPIPEPLEPETKQVLDLLRSHDGSLLSTGVLPSNTTTADSTRTSPSPQLSRAGPTITISNLTSTASSSPSNQLTTILSHLSHLLTLFSATPASILTSTLLLRSMNTFTTLNPIYGSFFTEPLPPARVTIACGDALGPGVEIMLSVVLMVPFDAMAKLESQLALGAEYLAHLHPPQPSHASASLPQPQHVPDTDPLPLRALKRGLHVQSWSYWAPANIGPYSQAIAAPVSTSTSPPGAEPASPADVEFVHIAGQIPLKPNTMDFGTEEFDEQAVLSLQHLWRIGRAVGVKAWVGSVGFVKRAGEGEDEAGDARYKKAIMAWKQLHEAFRPSTGEDDDEDNDEAGQQDLWDIRYGLGRGAVLAEEEDSRAALPDWEKFKMVDSGDVAPPCFVAEVDSLPRGAGIEWWSLGVAIGRSEEHVVEMRHVPAQSVEGDVSLEADVVKVSGTEAAVVWVAVKKREELELVARSLMKALGGEGKLDGTVTVYTALQLEEDWVTSLRAMVVPCRKVWGEHGELGAVVVLRRT